MSSNAAEHRQRLFFALWPDESVRKALDAAGQSVLGKRIKRVPADNLHITLAFAGSVSDEVAACLAEQAAGLRLPAFQLEIDCCDIWPRPRIAWIGPAHTPPALMELVGALRVVFETCGLQAETRAYQPHVTLARKISRLPKDARLQNPVCWSIRSFSLVESVTDPDGVRYQPRVHWRLEG
jgi:2'-5' RNA ligase